MANRLFPGTIAAAFCLIVTGMARGTPDFVEHNPLTQVYGEPTGTTMCEPDAPREGESPAIWCRVGYSFYWNAAAIYYTTNGTEPQGAFGVATNGQTVSLNWVRNEPYSPHSIDWLMATLPGLPYETTVRYKIGVWYSGGGIEVFANNSGCSDGTCDNPAAPQAVFQYTVKLPWPGRGHPNSLPNEGFPNIHFWKEEAVVGNNYTNVMIDRNGTVYDMYFPSAGCIQGIGTKNEGYSDGDDTFPAGLPQDRRGQMHINQALAGLRIDGTTYWLSNEGGAYGDHAQAYVTDTNVVHTTSRLIIAGNSILVDQYDFSPKDIIYPTDQGGTDPVRAIYIKRFLLTNNGTSDKTIDFYFNADFALNGGDGYDVMFADTGRGALVGYDNTDRMTSSAQEYNPTSFNDYRKNVSVYLAAALKMCDDVGSASGVPATNSWRDSSPDNTAGWVGTRLTLAVGQARELDVAMVGGLDRFAGASGTYNYFIVPALDWFHATSMAGIQQSTENYWRNWLASGVEADLPDDACNALFKRSLLATALHLDGTGGGVIAGMHNGAYPFIWPRDALYAAITLDRTGHPAEAAEVFRFLRDVAYRDNDTWGKGFWYQKYTTDGYIVWNAPQVDETANVTWAGYYHYLTTGDLNFLNQYYSMFYEAGRAMSEDSSISSNLRYEEAYKLMYSNNVWEDSYDTFLYSNAAVERGLRDAVRIASVTGRTADANLFNGRAGDIHDGLNSRLDWNGENTDVSQLGLVWPFETHTPTDPRMVQIIDRINGVATDRNGQNKPLVNYTGEWQDLINRYWNDIYWWNISNPNAHGSPWFLTTLWYGQYYARRQDHNAGKGDIDNFKYRLDRTRSCLGPLGLGAEQIAPTVSLLYPGQSDFVLQAAWPNAWESMSTLADCLMLFLDHKPDAPNSRIILAPKLPTGWSTMTYRNVKVSATKAIDVTCTESTTVNTQTFKNRNGGTILYDTAIRLPAIAAVTSVTQDNTPVPYSYDAATSRISVTGVLNANAGANTVVSVTFNDVFGDFNHDGDVDDDDLAIFLSCTTGPAIPQPDVTCLLPDADGDDDIDQSDFGIFQRCLSGSGQPANSACTQ